jgi:steroid delta-isomerase-like uncharacterized protein
MLGQAVQSQLRIGPDAQFRFLGVPTVMQATGETTNGGFGLIESSMMPPGFGSPYHTHHREDEAFYILQGEVAFVLDGEWKIAGAGEYVFGPREIPHGFQVVGSVPARILLLCSPAGFEHFVLDQATEITDPVMPPDMPRMMELAEQYGIDIHGPLPEMPEGLRRAKEDVSTLTQRWIRAFNERDWDTEKAMRTSNFRAMLSGAPEPLNSEEWSGFLTGFTAAFPDSRITVEESISDRDTIAVRWTLEGTHKLEFQGIPATGRRVKFDGIEYNRFENGKCAEHWSMFDNLALLRQLGAMQA